MERYALITGATSGIGHELAKCFAADGYNLIITGRYQETLDDTAAAFSQYGVTIIPLAADLSLPDEAVRLYEEVKRRGVFVEALVNDAGQANYGMFAETDLEKDVRDIQLNITSAVVLTKLFLRDMLAQQRGRILQVASVLSLYPAPLQAIYGGTKAFLLSFVEALANELKESAVTITALLPGPTDTDFFNKAGMEHTHVAQDVPLSDPADVAKDGYEAMMKGELTVVSGLKNKVMAGMARVLPDSAKAATGRKFADPS